MQACSVRLFRFAATGALVVGLAGCGRIAPATTPPQLDFTPGPVVIVTDQVYETPVFTVRYPSGWRVVTAAADQPISVVFVAPDERSTITLRVGTLDAAQFDPQFKTAVRGVTLKSETLVTAVGQTPTEQWEAFAPIFDRVVASIRAV